MDPFGIDAEELRQWIRTRPREVAVAIATRNALRNLPVVVKAFESELAHNLRDIQLLVLKVFRQCSVSLAWVAVTAREEQSYANAYDNVKSRALAISAADATNFATNKTTQSTDTATISAYFAANAATLINDDQAKEAAVDSIMALRLSNGQSAAFSTAISSDMQFIDGGISTIDLMETPLWSEVTPTEILNDWKRLVENIKGWKSKWDVWTDWYGRRFNGEPVKWELEYARAILPSEIWARGPEHVIDAILTVEHALERNRSTPPEDLIHEVYTQFAGYDFLERSNTATREWDKSPANNTGDATNIWLCQYRRSEMKTLESRLKPGQFATWRIHPYSADRLLDEMKTGDEAVLWRTIDEVTPDNDERSRGGIVAWGEVSIDESVRA